jgi:hypothetical protein
MLCPLSVLETAAARMIIRVPGNLCLHYTHSVLSQRAKT